MGALPKALAKRGHRVMVVVPRYANYENIVHTGVRHRVTMFGSSQEVREGSAKHNWGTLVRRQGACSCLRCVGSSQGRSPLGTTKVPFCDP